MFSWLKKNEPVAGAAALNVVIANAIVQVLKGFFPELELSTNDVAAIFTILTAVAAYAQRSQVRPVELSVPTSSLYPRSID